MKINSIVPVMTAIGSLFVGGGIPRGYDFIRYEVLGKAHDDKEACMRHLMSDHLSAEEECKAVTLDAKEGFASITIRPDDCIVIKRKDDYGNIVMIDILPDPKRIESIKRIYLEGDHGVVYAGESSFDFGVHKGDFNYIEAKTTKKKYIVVVRVYSDGCILQYEFDDLGRSKNWKWRPYRH